MDEFSIYRRVKEGHILRMHRKSVVLALMLGLFAVGAFADSITSVAPDTVPYFATESFIAIRGDGLAGTVSTLVVYDGIYEVEPGVISSNLLEVYVPIEITTVAGQHTLEV